MAPKKKPTAEDVAAWLESAEGVAFLASRAVERLSVSEMTDGMRMTPEHLAVLDNIAAGRPPVEGGKPPGNREITQALALRASMVVAKPRHEGPTGEGGTVIVMRDPFCTCVCTCGAENTHLDE